MESPQAAVPSGTPTCSSTGPPWMAVWTSAAVWGTSSSSFSSLSDLGVPSAVSHSFCSLLLSLPNIFCPFLEMVFSGGAVGAGWNRLYLAQGSPGCSSQGPPPWTLPLPTPGHPQRVHKLAVVVRYFHNCYKIYRVGPVMPAKTAKSKFMLGHLAVTAVCACLKAWTLPAQSPPILNGCHHGRVSHTKTNFEQVSLYDFHLIGK